MKTSRYAAALLALVLSSACGDSSTTEPAIPDATKVAETIDASTAGDTWDSFAKGFFDTYCGACHGAGDTDRDYSLLASVQLEQESISCGVSVDALPGCTISAKMFPVGNGAMPSDEERTRLVKWLNDGAK